MELHSCNLAAQPIGWYRGVAMSSFGNRVSRGCSFAGCVRHALLVLCGSLYGGASVAQVTFTNVASTAGVQFHQESETTIPIGGGAAWADFNNDGWEDLYVVQATGCNRLFGNLRDGRFSEQPNALGANDCAGISHGVAAADYDNDGDQDLYVTNRGQNRLFKNLLIENGQVSFVDATTLARMDNDGTGSSASAAWGDYDNDGFLDLVVVNHALYMPLDDGACQGDLLWRNNRDGSFTNVAGILGIADSGVTGKPGCGLAATWSDFDVDGDLDLWIVNDFGEDIVMNKLYRNDGPDGLGGWLLTDVSRQAGVDYPMFGMGIAVADINRDGFMDYAMSDVGPNNLALATGNGTYSEVAAHAGVLASSKETYGGDGLVSWGLAFIDVTGDGWEELVVANGGAPQDKFPGMFGADYVNLNPVYAYLNMKNLTFLEGHAAAGMTEEGYFRSIAVADYDRDGDMDIHVGTLQDDNVLYRNDTAATYNWIDVKAVGTASNRDAIGAKIVVEVGGRRQFREVSGGSSFLSRNSLTAHFGLGAATTVDRLVVIFPSGTPTVMNDVPANQILEVVEPTP